MVAQDLHYMYMYEAQSVHHWRESRITPERKGMHKEHEH